ncbi:hypothetical protein LNO81_19025 [Klebsiella variicola subsp. variicola]|nr:hypothetical protein [Klebsiella variicola subsp. variicola]
MRLREACLTAAKETQGFYYADSRTRPSGGCRLDAALARGAPLSPLDGIPVCWKDLFDIAGTRTTAGSATRLDAPLATHDAGMVARLTQAEW